MNNDVSLLIIGDKQNFESVERSILSFRNVYKDSDVVLVNVQHTPELNDLAEKLSINVYIPSKKYGYPMFKSTETNDLIEWCLEVIFKPSLLIKTKYFVFGEPDCFFVKETNLMCNSDIITHSSPNWMFGTLWPQFERDRDKDDPHKLFSNYVKEIEDKCKNIGIDAKKFESSLNVVFSAGTFINTDKFKNLYLNDRQLIIDIINAYLESTIKRYSYMVFMTDIVMSFVLILSGFTTSFNKNYVFGYYEKTILNVNDIDNVEKNVEIIHPLKIFYTEKKQSWGNYFERKVDKETIDKYFR